MLKVLLKKQLMEMFSGFFINGKTGKRKSKLAVLPVIALLIFVGIMFFAMFFSMAYMLTGLIEQNFSWIYFAIFGILATLLSTFGSVFMTYNTIYDAKDNDLLLSMPIRVSDILISRMLGLYLTCFVFSAVALIPCVIAYFIVAPFSFSTLVYLLLSLVLIPLFSLCLACILGWIIALFSSKMRNKGIISVIISILFFVCYYYFGMKINEIINTVLQNAQLIGEWIEKYLFLYKFFGLGFVGNVLQYFLFALIVLILFASISFIISRSFIKLATANKGSRKVKYKQKNTKQISVKTAIIKKELLYFKSSPVYMLNCSFGSVILLVFSVLLVVNGDLIFDRFALVDLPAESLKVFLCLILSFIASTNNITAPSISLEAKTLWFLKSAPLKITDIFFGKIMLHYIITGVPLFIGVVCSAFLLKQSVFFTLLSFVFSSLYVIVCAQIGLILNILFPKFEWINETIPIKQSLSVFVSMFTGMLLTALTMSAYVVCLKIVSTELFLSFASLLLIIAVVLLSLYLKKQGSRRFSLF